MSRFRNDSSRIDRSFQTDGRAQPGRPDGRRRRVGALLAALALAGCGGSDDSQQAAPALPAALGNELAAETADVEEALRAGDPARARAEAEELVALVDAAIERGDVPRALRGELRAGAQRLLDLIPSPPPPPPPPPPAPEPPPPAPPPPAPEEDPCQAIREQLDALEAQIGELPGDDPLREALDQQLDGVKDALKDCERENRGDEDGEGDDDGDED